MGDKIWVLWVKPCQRVRLKARKVFTCDALRVSTLEVWTSLPCACLPTSDFFACVSVCVMELLGLCIKGCVGVCQLFVWRKVCATGFHVTTARRVG